jgi:radical SAM-linked protein
VERDSGTTAGQSTAPDLAPTAPARQRWRLVLARAPEAPRLGGRELGEEFERAIEATGLPLVRPAGRSRGRVAFGAPLPLGIAAERELADIVLTELVPRSSVRDRIASGLPDGWLLVDLFDVWLGAPPLAGQVAAADYRIELGMADVSAVTAAAEALLRADALPRHRLKGGSLVAYDLRPLLVDIQVVEPGPPVEVRVRTRFDPVLGTGRPEEVVAALGERIEAPLVVGSSVRERLILADEPG